MTAVLRRPRRPVRPRAVGILWFTVVFVPFFMAGAALASDFTMIYLGNRQAARGAESAAIGGAFEFQPDSVHLDPARASATAHEVLRRWQDTGAARLARFVSASVSVVPGPSEYGPTDAVVVTVDYEIENLVFVRYLTGAGAVRSDTTRVAVVCRPGTDVGPTDGYCRRPVGV